MTCVVKNEKDIDFMLEAIKIGNGLENDPAKNWCWAQRKRKRCQLHIKNIYIF